MKQLIAAALMASIPTICQAKPWSLLTISNDGRISIIHNIGEKECAYARDRYLDVPATDNEKRALKEDIEARMKKEWESYYAALVWRAAHPQCDHVSWQGTVDNGARIDQKKEITVIPTKDNGTFCNIPMGMDENALGQKDPEDYQNPDKNPRIADEARREANADLGYGNPKGTAECFQ